MKKQDNAILHTPTQKGKIPQSVLDLTNFQVTGVFAGSFGITLEKEETQLEAYSGMSQLTSVLGEFFTVLESTDHDELLLSSITPFGKRVVAYLLQWRKATGQEEYVQTIRYFGLG